MWIANSTLNSHRAMHNSMPQDNIKCIRYHHQLRLGLLRAWDERHAGGALADCLAEIQRDATEHKELVKRAAKATAERDSAKRNKCTKINHKAVLRRVQARLEHHRADAAVVAPTVRAHQQQGFQRQLSSSLRAASNGKQTTSCISTKDSDQNQAHSKIETSTSMCSHGQCSTVISPSQSMNGIIRNEHGLSAQPAGNAPSQQHLLTVRAPRSCRTSDPLQLDLLSSRHVRAEVRAKLIAKALCREDIPAGTGRHRRCRPRSTPAAFLGRGKAIHQSQPEQSAASPMHGRRVQTACARPTQPVSARRVGQLGPSVSESGDWGMDSIGPPAGPPRHALELSSPGLTPHVSHRHTYAATAADAVSMRSRPRACTSHAPRGAILYSAALELDGQAEHLSPDTGAVQHDCSPLLDANAPKTEVHQQAVQARKPRPKSAKTVSNAHALQAAEIGEKHENCQDPQDKPMAAKTRMMLRDTMSAPSTRRGCLQAVQVVGVNGTGRGLTGGNSKAARVAYQPDLGQEVTGAGGRMRRRLRVPSAVEGRYLRESVLESSLQRRCQSAARQRARSATLGKQMKDLLGNLERVKPELRQPRGAVAQFNEELPEWDRWRSLILIPTKSFQVAQRPIRCE